MGRLFPHRKLHNFYILTNAEGKSNKGGWRAPGEALEQSRWKHLFLRLSKFKIRSFEFRS